MPNPFYGVITDPRSSLSASTTQRWRLFTPYPQYISANRTNDPAAGDTQYHSVQFKFERRFSQGLSMLAHYTISKAIDNVGAGSGSWTWLGGGSTSLQDIFNLKNERALSPATLRSGSCSLSATICQSVPARRWGRLGPVYQCASGRLASRRLHDLPVRRAAPGNPVRRNALERLSAAQPDRRSKSGWVGHGSNQRLLQSGGLQPAGCRYAGYCPAHVELSRLPAFEMPTCRWSRHSRFGKGCAANSVSMCRTPPIRRPSAGQAAASEPRLRADHRLQGQPRSKSGQFGLKFHF